MTASSQPASGAITPARARALLATGEVELVGLMRNASNYTFLARVTDAELLALAVYKPREGEAPLWDFPDGTLYLREVAAYEVAEALGFRFVPVTIVRDGPHGVGSLQIFVDADADAHYLTLPPEFDDVFRRVCAFDLLINNADRKSGHCLLERQSNRIWVVDHGVSFHEQPKLRTVIWDFAGEPVPADALDAIASFAERLDADPQMLSNLLSEEERRALRLRAERIVASGVLPHPGPGRPYPWPPV